MRERGRERFREIERAWIVCAGERKGKRMRDVCIGKRGKRMRGVGADEREMERENEKCLHRLERDRSFKCERQRGEGMSCILLVREWEELHLREFICSIPINTYFYCFPNSTSRFRIISLNALHARVFLPLVSHPS